MQTRLILSLYSVVTLNVKSRSPKPDQIFKPSQRYNIGSLARISHLVQEIRCRQSFFGQNLNEYSFYTVVTLEIRSRSPQSDETFKPFPFQRYNT